MLTQYIQAAMRQAKYEVLEDATFYGEIPGFQGVYANAEIFEDCRNELLEVLEGWMYLQISDQCSLPVGDGIELAFKRV